MTRSISTSEREKHTTRTAFEVRQIDSYFMIQVLSGGQKKPGILLGSVSLKPILIQEQDNALNKTRGGAFNVLSLPLSGSSLT